MFAKGFRKRVSSCFIFILASLSLVPHGLAAQSQSDFSLLDTFNTRRVLQARMAPNGERVAFVTSLPRRVNIDDDGANWRELYVVDKKGNARAFVAGRKQVDQVHWSPDSRHIWFVSDMAEDKIWDIYRIAEDGGEARRIIRHDNHITGFALSDDGNKLVFWAPSNNQAQLIRQQKGFHSQVFEQSKPAHQLWLVDLSQPEQAIKAIFDQHVLSAEFVDLGSKLAIWVKHSETANVEDKLMRAKLSLIDLDGQVKNTLNHVGKMDRYQVSPDGKHLAFIGTDDVTDPAPGRLFLAQPDSSEIKLLTADLDGHIVDLAWLSNSKIIFAAHVDTKSVFASQSIARRGRGYRQLYTHPGRVSQLDASEDGDEIAMVISAAEHPPELYWANTKQTNRMTLSNAWLKDKALAKQRVIEYPSRDGLTLEGILVEPADRFKKPWPLLMFVHGGPEAHYSNAWLDRYISPVQYAASLGFASFFANYRGSTGRGVAFTQLGQHDYAGAEFNDLIDAKTFLQEKGWIDGERVGITGASYGGYASAWGATALSEHFAAAVSSMGIGYQVSKFGTTDIPLEMYHQHAKIWPWQDWQWFLSRSPIMYADQQKTPLLLLHGKRDFRVHYSQSMELYRHLTLRGQAPVRLVLFPKEGHGFKRTAAQYEYAARLMRWMQHFVLNGEQDAPLLELGLEPANSDSASN